LKFRTAADVAGIFTLVCCFNDFFLFQRVDYVLTHISHLF
jgi:hypothetical protein